MTHRPTRRQPWVLKLGGSLSAAPRTLAAWLRALGAGGGRVIVVAGGGDFADAVRAAQRRHRCDDATAHRMALLAMEQQALLLAGLCPSLRPAASRRALDTELRDGAVALWLPSRMLRDRTDVAASWDVTSDSLAAWLAGEVEASCLLLVKSVGIAAARSAAALVRAQVVDRAFPLYLARCVCPCQLLHAREHAGFAHALHTGIPPGVAVLSRRPPRA